jgi:ABC-type transport system substrate-binding protein
MAAQGILGNNPDVKAFPFDPAKARALLDEAGWTVDSTTKVRTKGGVQLAITAEYGAGDAFNVGESAETQAMQQFLADVNVKVNLLASERGAMLPRLIGPEKRKDLIHGGWVALPVPDGDFVYSNFSCKERPDRYPTCDPANAEFERLYALQKSQLDSTLRSQTWNSIGQWVHDRPIGIYMVQPNKTWISNKVANVTPRPDDIMLFDGLVVGQ